MKEREKLFTATLVLILSIFFTALVSYTNNLFGIKDYISGNEVNMSDEMSAETAAYEGEIEEEIREGVLTIAEQVKSLYFQGKYGDIYCMGTESLVEKGSCETFEETFRESQRPIFEQSQYTLLELAQSVDKAEYKIKYGAFGDELVIYIKEENGEMKVSGLKKTKQL